MKKVVIKHNKSRRKLIKAVNKIKKPNQKLKKRKVWKIFKYFITTLLVFFIIGIISAVSIFVYFAKDLPDPNKLLKREPIQSTKIFDRTGEHLLYEISGDQKRTLVDINTLPDYIKNATVAIEDNNFYNHHGIDFKGILRAAWSNLSSNKKKGQGGSTITQQLVKNAILSSEKTYSRKIKEAILSLEIERKFSKNEILQMYLNEIPYGSNIYGIEAASQRFFNKPAKNLTISEAAVLAALPQATTYFSPYGTNTDELETRRKKVLNQMFKNIFISQEEYTQAIKEKPKFANSGELINAPHFVMYIKEKLVEKFGENEVERGGLRVYTTLDWEKQQIAEQAIIEGAENNEKRFNAKNAALTAIDPKTGQILAMVGSRDYFDIENDGNVNVAIRLRQPGSSFKPFAYVAAFQKGYTPETILFDVPTNFNGYSPHNYNNKYIGPITMRSALQMSKNVVSVKTLYLAGLKDTLKLAQKLGITTLNNPSRYGLSLVLGGGEVKLLDIVSAYGVFANDGIRNPTSCILKIEDSNGNTIEKYENNSQKILNTQDARLINNVLSDNEARTPAFGSRSKLYLTDRPVAAKTGTTNSSRDAWTIGYTPSLSAGVWVGNNDNTKMSHAGGSSAAAPIWNSFMEKALKETPVENFTKPLPINTDKPILNGIPEDPTIYKIDRYSGKLATEYTPPSQIEEITLQKVHNILYYVDKDNPQGPIPKNPTSDSQYYNWEEPVQVWAQENDFTEEPPTEYDNIHTDFNKPKIIITQPQEGDIIPPNSSFYISVDIVAPLSIKQVDFFFGNQLIQTDTIAPYKIKFNLPADISYGQYPIKAIIYDIAENSSENIVNINISSSDIHADANIDDQNILVNILNPEKIEFPLTLTTIIFSNNPIYSSQISQVQIINKKTREIIGSASLEDESLSTSNEHYYQVQWMNKPQNGIYLLFARAIMTDGRISESNNLNIKIN